MQELKKQEVSVDRYVKIRNLQGKNNNSYREQVIGSRRKLFVFNKLAATINQNKDLPLGNIKESQFTAFLGMFNRNLYAQFKKHQQLFELKVKFSGRSRNKNKQLWNEIPVGSVFYNMDLSSAYWQMAFKLGYISKKLHDNYIYRDEYKAAKRYCVSFLARSNKMRYISPEKETYEITCDNKVFQGVYDNIRNELYNTITEVVNECESCIEYNIDGITILKNDYSKVKKIFKHKNLMFKINQCIKINEKQYLYSGILRNFKK